MFLSSCTQFRRMLDEDDVPYKSKDDVLELEVVEEVFKIVEDLFEK